MKERYTKSTVILSQSGGFYSAEDADSLVKHSDVEKKEGAFNVWAWEDVNRLLSDQVDGKEGVTWAQIFSKHFDVREDGNIAPFQVIMKINQFFWQEIIFFYTVLYSGQQI